MDKVNELKGRVREAEDLLKYMTKNQMAFGEKGFAFLIEEVRILKIQLAEAEAEERKQERVLMINN